MNYPCPYCNQTSAIYINTYKHLWIICGRCGTALREQRQKYFFDRWFFRPFIRYSPLNSLYGKTLLPATDVVKDKNKLYDFYREIIRKGEKGTPWEKVADSVLDDFRKLGIDYSGKSVLDISGAPGFLSNKISYAAKRTVVTEFSPAVVEAMRKFSGLEAVKFDYQNDAIDRCITGKFDLVLIIYSLTYCNDLRGFVNSLKNLVHENSIVYVRNPPPTLGMFVRWQFEEYAYTRGWPVEVIKKCFEETGFTELQRDGENSYRWNKNWFNAGRNPLKKIAHFPHYFIAKYFLNKALKQKNKINPELFQKSVRQVFVFKPANLTDKNTIN